MADTAVSTVVNKLTELAAKEALFQVEVRKDIKVLRDKLEWLQTFIKDADQKHRAGSNQFITVWVRQTRDVAFNLEDILDEFFTKVQRTSMPGYGWKAVLKFQWITDCFVQIRVAHKLSSKIATIKDRLEELNAHKTTYHINFDPSSSCWAPSFSKKPFSTWDRDIEDPAVGLDDKIRDLKEQLLDGTKKRTVISITGKSGIGKTLIAKKVYGSIEIKKGFEIVAWKSLTMKFRMSDTFNDIYLQISSQLDQEDLKKIECYEDFGTIISKLLKKRKYLLVLDGIVSLADWKHMRAFLPNNKKGSRVLLIPRPDSEVARLSDSGIITFNLDFLFTEENSQKLFGHKFFEKSSYPPEFGPYIRNIHIVTGGHPLTIVLLAGLLRTKDSASEWEKVFNHLKVSGGTNPIESMLSLSFDDLPHQLKSCFMYLAAIQESTRFPVDRLVHLWIAEGFIQPKPGRTLEDIGEGYLKELIERSLLQVHEKDECGGVAVVSVNNLLHSFVRSEAYESSFVEIHDNANLVSSGTIRRLSIQNYTHKRMEFEKSFPKLRTLLCDCVEENPRYHMMKFLLGSKYLRVLDLRGLIIDRFPNGIGDMIHLRYFGISCDRLKKLPSSIGKLLNLQTIDIRETSVHKLPMSFWRISTLRHVLVDNLELPTRIGKLYNLQTLQSANCTNWNQKKALLEKMINIRTLELRELSKSQANVVANSLYNLEFLKHLCLQVRKGHSLPSSIFGTSSLRSLQTMELYGQLDNLEDVKKNRFKAWYNLPNLISLTLVMSNINQEFVNMLAKLPCLANLYLCKSSYDGKILGFLPKGFQNLRKLELSSLANLEELKEIPTATMPKLNELTLWECVKLTKLPEGLKGLKELKEVRIYEMKELVEVIRGKVGRDFDEIKHVPVVVTRL